MAIQTLSFISLILRPYVQQAIHPDGWAYLLDQSDPNRNFDGEIMAFGAMSGGDIDTIIDYLWAFGYQKPDSGEASDMVISSMLGGTSFIPSWLELVDVTFFDEMRPPVKARKKKDSGVYKLLNFEADTGLPTKGYDCDWSPHIGKIIAPKHSQAVEYTPATTENFQRPDMMKVNLFFWIFVLLVFGTFLKNSTDLFEPRSTSENSNEVQRETTKKIKVEPVELPLILPDLILMDPLKKLID